MLKLRTDSNYHIGYPDDSKGGRLRFSHFLAIDTNEMTFHQPLRQSQSQSNALQQQTSQDSDIQPTISVNRCCKIIIDCLNSENNWAVMQLVMKGLPSILQNKAFFRGVDMEQLALTVIGLATKVNLNEIKFKPYYSLLFNIIVLMLLCRVIISFSFNNNIRAVNHVWIHSFQRNRNRLIFKH